MNQLGFFGTIMYDGIETVDSFHNYDRFYKNIEHNFIIKELRIQDSPRPELLSYKLYGTPEYYWVLLLINEIYDPFYDWIMTEQAVYEYTEQKYKNLGGPNEVAYHISRDKERFWNVYERPVGSQKWYDKSDKIGKYLQYDGPLIPVTNLEYETIENENKRLIRVVQPEDIQTFVSQFRIEMERSRRGIDS